MAAMTGVTGGNWINHGDGSEPALIELTSHDEYRRTNWRKGNQ